jgi:16S rRNA (cytosine1402-N4)-methyltransferase
MTAGSGAGKPDAAGGLARHVPVLVRQVVDYLNVRDGGLIIDATFGAGGHTRAILAQAQCRVIAIDRDPEAIARGADLVEASGGRLTLMESEFSALDAAAAGASVDGVVFDLGVSSMQIDAAERGFSFRHDGPLDMRMGRDGPGAAAVVAHASERDLATVIAALGEERHARAVARAIVRARALRAIATTEELAEIVARVVRAKPGEIHPATRTFQALRLLVNDELGELARALGAAERVLRPGGRLVVVAFHSLEDRIVKTFLSGRSGTRGRSRHQPELMRKPATFRLLTKRPVTPDNDEIAANPRARSAKLRAAERTEAPARTEPAEILVNAPSLAQVLGGEAR